MKTLLELRKQMEVDFLKTKTYEEINDMFNQLNDKLRLAEIELKKLRVGDVSVSVCEDQFCVNGEIQYQSGEVVSCDKCNKQTVH